MVVGGGFPVRGPRRLHEKQVGEPLIADNRLDTRTRHGPCECEDREKRERCTGPARMTFDGDKTMLLRQLLFDRERALGRILRHFHVEAVAEAAHAANERVRLVDFDLLPQP
jgi:hypothetical protein